ncbi:hypothetical protein CcaCcLH18_12848 [Colletotrichum camelliae]|nr:hypothetical protein CcaCcLH18_12848 [Colletotrichum camelliae]
MASVGLPPSGWAEQQALSLGMPRSVCSWFGRPSRGSATKHQIGAPATAGPHAPDATTLSNAQPTSVRPAELHSISQHPRYVRIAIEGDVGVHLATVQPRAPPSTAAATKVDGSIPVCGGDEVQTGWVDDYFGLSDGERPYGRGVGWLSQEADMMESPQWPRQFVCSWCSERWNVAHWPQSRKLKGTCTIGLDAASSGAPLGFTHPLPTMQYYPDHDHPAAEPCVHGPCSGLAERIKKHDCLSKTDRAVSSRLMDLINDLDSRGQKSISQPVRTVLGADEIGSPAVLEEYRQSMVHLGFHAPETFRVHFFGVETEQ